jgi:hypothetical protein
MNKKQQRVGTVILGTIADRYRHDQDTPKPHPMIRNLFLTFVLGLTLFFASSHSVYGADELQKKRAKLVDFVVNASFPKTGLTHGLSEPTMVVLVDFFQHRTESLSFLDLSDAEFAELKAGIDALEDLNEMSVDAMMGKLGLKVQARLERLATMIDGLERIPNRLKFNQIAMSPESIASIKKLRKKFAVERTGPLASANFASSGGEESSLRFAVADVKCKIDFGLRMLEILTPDEINSFVDFIVVSESEAKILRQLVDDRYRFRDGFYLESQKAKP